MANAARSVYLGLVDAKEIDRMKKRMVFLVVALFLFLSLTPPGLHAASPSSSVVLTFGSFSEREGILIVAQDQGFFRKHELEVQLVYVRTGSVAMSALAAGGSHFFHGSA